MKEYIQKVQNKIDLSAEESKNIFQKIFEGVVSEEDMKAFLLALHEKGEAVSEIEGAAASMRAHMVSIHAPENAIDIVGTGGDGHKTYNISSATAFVVAGAGVPVAKHGNKAATSLSGASDVLSQLGIKLDAPFEILEEALNEIGIAFLFAPRHHPAMRFVAPVRKALNVRTIFNLLGPLTNPANVKLHMLGVFDVRWVLPLAQTLHSLGSRAAWVVAGHKGLDELSTTGPSDVSILSEGTIEKRQITPEMFGLPASSLEDLKGGTAEENAKAMIELFEGKPSAYRDIVVMNAAAALLVAGKMASMKEAAALASASIDEGCAMNKLHQLIKRTNGD